MNESDKSSGSPAENPAPTPPSAVPPAQSPQAQPQPQPSGAPSPEIPSPEIPSPAAPSAGKPADGGASPPSAAAAAGAGGEGAEGGDGAPRKRRRRRRRGRGESTGEGGEGDTPAATGPEGAEGPEGATGEAASAGGTRDSAARGRRKSGRGRDRAGKGGGRSERANPRERSRGPGGRSGGGSGDTTHLATQAVRALSAMAQQLLRIEGVDPLAMPRYLELALRVPLDGGKDFRQAAGTAVEQILKRVREVREHEAALRPGAVFSYFKGSSHAEGCRPTEPRHVFDGYGSTGKPQFTDFVTMAIERKNEGIDKLLAGEEVILTQVTMGRVLRTQQLAEFGGESPVYKILGQVNAGLFKVLGAAGKCAFSFQLLRGTSLEGRVRLRLHPVSAVEPMDLADPAIMQILSRFQRKLDTEALRLEGRIKNGETDEEEFVLPLLNDLAKQLQNRTRNTGRRTQHGLERSEEGQRPTSRAYPDAGEASDDAILWDVDQSTIIVVGPKGRVHVFSPDAKHVTSVAMQRSAIDRRRQLGRWRLAEPEERGEFRIQVRRSLADQAAAPKTEGAEATAPPVVEASPAAPAASESSAPAVSESPAGESPASEPQADEPPASEPPAGEPPATEPDSTKPTEGQS